MEVNYLTIKYLMLFLIQNKAAEPFLYNLANGIPTPFMRSIIPINHYTSVKKYITSDKVQAFILLQFLIQRLLKDEGVDLAVTLAFEWATTPQHHNFWFNLHVQWRDMYSTCKTFTKIML